MDKNNKHIDDDFLKKLVSLPEDEKLPEDFTQKIMNRIPKAAPVEPKPVNGSWFNYRNTAIAIVVAAIAGYLIFSFDVAGLINLAMVSSTQNPQNYLKIITSVIEIFKQGFAGIQFTSISITAFLALVLLAGFDKFLKYFLGGHQAKVV